MIKIEFLNDRTKAGRLVLLSDAGQPLCGPFPALGLADAHDAIANHNPHRDTLLPFGDTPLGEYNFSVVNTPVAPAHSYGPNGVIMLDPTSGDALIAKHNHRSGIWIHGGDPGASNHMRPTHGCVRLFNDDLKLLMAVLKTYSGAKHCEIANAPTGRMSLHMVESELYHSDPTPLIAAVYPHGLPTLPANAHATAAGVSAATPHAQFSIDTDLTTVKSPLTAQNIDDYFANQHNPAHRDLKGIGTAVIAVSAAQNVNATYIVAHAIWETGWGTSKIYKDKHNLFGYAAYDHSPYTSATQFADRDDCIAKVVKLIKEHYLTPGGIHFALKPCLGNKNYGMNVHYASDPNWGNGIASVCRQIERSI